ncbi:hypothetical protein CTEN210_11989 [Chaetoceros tenuissimus]|uniref:HMG box domain-containing protein n=1 Tax=Chaetoceros tenuissimus TaxID=426638 RepID=A0AAD3D0N2_9STRA|nr:hypothetical protein CTEN210_11989 [Chaetoceros tenuissimus]
MCEEENNDDETSQSGESDIKAIAGSSPKRSAFELLVDQRQEERSSTSATGENQEVSQHHSSASINPTTSHLNSSMINNTVFYTESGAPSHYASARRHERFHQTIRRGSTSMIRGSEKQQEILDPSFNVSAFASVMPQHRYVFNSSTTVPSSSNATRQHELLPSSNIPPLLGATLLQESSTDVGNHRNNQFAVGMHLPYRVNSNMIAPSTTSSNDLLSTGNHTSVPTAQVQSRSIDNEQRKQGKASSKKEKMELPSMKETASKKRKKPGRKKKKEGAPKRPMSAYNFFFQEERKRLLDALPKQDDSPQKKKRKDRSPHNKISFSTLGKTIGRNWKQLGSVEMARYEELARRDTDRYLREMKAFEAKEKQGAAGLVDSMGHNQSESNTMPKNVWFATNEAGEYEVHPSTSTRHEFQGNSMQQTISSQPYMPFNTTPQYPHLLYQQTNGTPLLGNSMFTTNNSTHYQAPQQAPYTSQSMPHQHVSSQSISNQETPNAALFSYARESNIEDDIIEPMPMNSQVDTQEESPTLYYFEKESESPDS